MSTMLWFDWLHAKVELRLSVNHNHLGSWEEVEESEKDAELKPTEEAAEPENDDGDVPNSHQLLWDSPQLDDDPLLHWCILQVRSSLLYF